MSVVIAVDLGGTKIAAAVVRDDGTVHAESHTRRPTGPALDVERLRTVLRDVLHDAAAYAPDAAAIGVGTAGPFQADGVIAPVNLRGVHGFRLRDEVRAIAAELFQRDLPVIIGHDGGALALAESWIGAAAASSASMSIVVSTGIGGGIVIDGVLLTGAAGNAGHLGQTFVRDEHATLEELASGPSSVRWAVGEGWSGATGEDLARDAANGHPIARAAIVRSARLVGLGITSAVTLLDLELVVIGGGFAHVSDDYVDIVAETLRTHAPLAGGKQARVVRSMLGADGPIIGAAALALGSTVRVGSVRAAIDLHHDCDADPSAGSRPYQAH